MLSNKPYLIRAFNEWIVDSGCTPFLVVNASYPHCRIPKDFVENGEITFNISNEAIRDLHMSNEAVEFRASFSGVVYVIYAPIKAILAIYAQENGQGMFFDFEEDEENVDWNNTPMLQSSESLTQARDKKRSSHLKLVE